MKNDKSINYRPIYLPIFMKTLKSLLLGFLLCVAANVLADDFTMSIKVEPKDTAGLKLYLFNQGYDSDNANVPMVYADGAYVATCSKSENGFYEVACVVNGGQISLPCYSLQSKAELTIKYEGEMPIALICSDRKERPNYEAIAGFSVENYRTQMELWKNLPSVNEDGLKALIDKLQKKADELSSGKKVSDKVKQYIGIWAFLSQHNLVEGYNRLHQKDRVSPFAIIGMNPMEVLNTDLTLLHRSGAMVCYSTVPKKDLDSRLQFINENYTAEALREAVQKLVLNYYIMYYKYEEGVEQGLEEMTAATRKYNLREEYLARFQEKVSAVHGAEFPDVELLDVDGNKVSFSKFKGKYVYIDLWASWCVPCCKQVPYLHELQKELKNDKVVFVSISSDTKMEPWKKKMEELDMHGNQLINLDNKLFEKLNVSSIPRFLVYDPAGCLYISDAPRPSSGEKLKSLLEELK